MYASPRQRPTRSITWQPLIGIPFIQWWKYSSDHLSNCHVISDKILFLFRIIMGLSLPSRYYFKHSHKSQMSLHIKSSLNRRTGSHSGERDRKFGLFIRKKQTKVLLNLRTLLILIIHSKQIRLNSSSRSLRCSFVVSHTRRKIRVIRSCVIETCSESAVRRPSALRNNHQKRSAAWSLNSWVNDVKQGVEKVLVAERAVPNDDGSRSEESVRERDVTWIVNVAEVRIYVG